MASFCRPVAPVGHRPLAMQLAATPATAGAATANQETHAGCKFGLWRKAQGREESMLIVCCCYYATACTCKQAYVRDAAYLETLELLPIQNSMLHAHCAPHTAVQQPSGDAGYHMKQFVHGTSTRLLT